MGPKQHLNMGQNSTKYRAKTAPKYGGQNGTKYEGQNSIKNRGQNGPRGAKSPPVRAKTVLIAK